MLQNPKFQISLSLSLLFLGGIIFGLFGRLIIKDQGLASPFTGITQILPRQVKVVGFVPYWLLDKPSIGSAPITQLSYFSLTLDSDGTVKRQVNAQEEEPGWTAFTRNQSLTNILANAKNQKKGLSLTVFSGNQATIESLITNPERNADNLVADVVPIMQRGGFSDLNLDVESIVSASPSAQANFTRFVARIKKGLSASGSATLTLDLQPISLFQPYLSDPLALGQIVDYIVLMTYDFHFPGSVLAGPVAPMGGAGSTRVFDVQSSLNAALKEIPRTKILLGIPLYGYEWQTIDGRPDAPTIPGTGFLASDSRVAQVIDSCTNCTKGLDQVAQEPYLFYPESTHFHEIYYEDNQSIQAKIDLAKNTGIGGVALWAIGYENNSDFTPLKNYLGSISL